MILIDQFFLMALIGLAIVALFLLIFKTPMKKIVLISGIYLYITVVLGLTLCPIPLQRVDIMVEARNNYIPFATIMDCIRDGNTRSVLLQVGGNIAMFVPAGVFLYVLVKGKRPAVVLLLAILFPVLVEVLQHVVGIVIGYNYRAFDVDDIILGSMGCLAGYFLCMAVFSRIRLAKSKKAQR